jgi:hypothetical protein
VLHSSVLNTMRDFDQSLVGLDAAQAARGKPSGA